MFSKIGVPKDIWKSIFFTVSRDVLSTTLRQFYAEVKTKKGKPLSPSSLVGIRASLYRYITKAPLNSCMNIISDSEFLSANNMFESKQKLYRKLNNEKPKHKPCIESGDLRKLSSYFQTNNSRPDINQEFTWFNICYYFGRRGREGWRSLSKNSFEIFTKGMLLILLLKPKKIINLRFKTKLIFPIIECMSKKSIAQ